MSSPTFDKFLQEIDNMTVVQLSDFIKAIEERYDVSAAMPAAGAVAAGGASEAAAEAKSEFKVTLKDFGSEKIKVIKALKSAISSLSLSEAKQAVEGAPSVVAEAAPKDEAEKIKKALEDAGAKVELS